MTFKSFIRVPSDSELFMAGWASAVVSDGKLVRERLARLSRRLFLPYSWPDFDSEFERWENPGIPAGYTYLLQFLAHDSVQSSVPTSGLHRFGNTVRNHRSAPLELQTLYGAGFDGCLTAMTELDCQQLKPSKLRLNQIRFSDARDSACPFRDIARTSGLERNGARPSLGNVLIADDRNDNSALISQMTVLFSMLHNVIVDLLHHARTGARKPAAEPSYYAELYYDARSVCVEAYRTIVERDLLRRLLHPAAYERCFLGDAPFIDQDPETHLPMEFAQALRLGHSMVRPHYRINDVHNRREDLIDVLLTTSRSRPWRLPIDESWVVQWSKFFAIDGSRPNLSRRIGPSLSADLVSDLVFDALDDTSTGGLAYRDLLNCALLPVWSLPAMISELSRRAPDLTRRSRLLSDGPYREECFRAWLAHDQGSSHLTNEDIVDISKDPPLTLFVLLEAALDMHGERLGILGSILIGEPLAKILRREPGARRRSPFCDGEFFRSDALRERPRKGSIGDAAALSSMAELVQFLCSVSNLDESVVTLV